MRDMREGFVYMVRTPWLLATLLFASLMILVMMGPLEVLIPFLVKDVLGGGPSDHSYVLAGFGLGGAVGSWHGVGADAAPLPHPDEPRLGCRLPAVRAHRGDHAGLGRRRVRLRHGVLFSAPMVIWGTLLQRRVPPALLGRVASLDFFVSVSLMPCRWRSPVVRLEATFAVAGIVPILVAAVAIVWARLPQCPPARHPVGARRRR